MCSLIVFNHELGLGAQELYIIKQDQGRQETSIHLETIHRIRRNNEFLRTPLSIISNYNLTRKKLKTWLDKK